MRRSFDKTRPDFIARHLITATVELERVVAGVKLNRILFLANEEADGVQSHFEFWADSDKASSNLFLNSVPLELKCKDLIISVGFGIGSRTRLNVSLVVDIATLFAEVKLQEMTLEFCEK